MEIDAAKKKNIYIWRSVTDSKLKIHQPVNKYYKVVKRLNYSMMCGAIGAK